MDIEVSEAVKDILSAKTLDEFDRKLLKYVESGFEVYPHETEVLKTHQMHLIAQKCQGEYSDIPTYAQCLIRHRKTKLGEI
jgi:regulator of sigma D